MANFWYNQAAQGVMEGTIDLDLDDIRVILLEVDEEDHDHAFIAALLATSAAELTSTGYARVALANEAVNLDDANNRSEFDADDTTFASVSQLAAEVAVAAVVYKHVTNDADSIPLFHLDDGGFPITPQGGDIVIQWDAEGIAQGQT